MDLTLNKYVYITENNVNDFVGHNFKTDVGIVTLVSYTITEEYMRVYSPVTYGTLCYYVNGLLTMPGNTEIFTNIFDIDENTLTYITAVDVSIYGLYTYEEFNVLIEIPEYVFNAFKLIVKVNSSPKGISGSNVQFESKFQ